jgi:electron transfer flavoprotein alpha subunit
MEGSATILVLAEVSDDKPAASAFELLALASELARENKLGVSAIAFGGNISGAAQELIAGGADRVFLADDHLLSEYEADVWVPALVDVIRRTSAGVILCSHTNTGADLAPRLAFRLDGTVATNCETIKIENGKLQITRPCYGGKARSTLWLKKLPAIVTVRAQSQKVLPPDSKRTGEIVQLATTADGTPPRTRVKERRKYEVTGPQLETAKIVVGGGRGLGGPDGFRLLESLAEKLGGVVGASRVACDLGWCPPSMQIGLTGKTIAPDLYLAIGISGASQHMAGCGSAKTIVAINADREAPIFDEAGFGVVGDYKELLPKLIEEVQRQKEK